MKKKLLFIPAILVGLVLTGCASGLKDNFTEADQSIDTPWVDYSLPATGVEFAEGEAAISLKKGETHTYQYTIVPKGATANSLNWFSDNENVATIDKGTVTAVGGGDAVITVSSPENSFDPVELSVSVTVPLVDFTLDVPQKLDWDEEYTFPVTYDPADTTEKELVYEISESSVAGLVSINEQGVVTTTHQNGTAKLKVTGGSIVKEYTLTVNSIPVSSVTISGAAHEVEVNKTLQLSATVLPADARELAKKGVRFHSRNADIATVDEITGVVVGVAPGTAQIYAECGGVESTDYAVEVYKVSATSVSITTPDFTLSNSDNALLTKQLEYQMVLDRTGHEAPSNYSVAFASNNASVATVNDSGLVTAAGPGNAVITVTVSQPGLDDLTDSVNVAVNIVSTALSITGGNSFYNDSTLTLTAVLTPANVSDPTITWSIEQNPVIVNLSATEGASVTLTPVNNEVTGEVKVTASNASGAHNEITVTVNERPSFFTAGHHYIVGSALYNTGESVRVDGKSSWTTAKYAYHFTYNVQDPSVYEQFKGTIKFQAGDQFKYFIGEDYWVPAWEQQEGWESKGWHIEQEGANNAFVKGQMRFVSENENHEFVVSEAADANIEVVEAGYYDLYAKLYKNDDNLWYSLYIEKVPALSVEISELTMGLEESYQIQAHDWIGELTFTVKSGADLITLSPTGLVTGKGTAGVAVITVNDNRNVPVDVTITLQNGAHAGKTVYLNANGMFDTDNVVPFVHSWGEDGASASVDIKMNKVEGQTIIYTATIPLDHTKIDFVRCPEGSTELVWENIYNQSKDQIIPTDGKDMFTMTGWCEESDGSHRTYLDGSWSIFDSTHVYTTDGGQTNPEDPHGDAYIMYGNDPTWNYLTLQQNLLNDGEMMGTLDLEANTEFVIKMGDGDWRHFENNKTASSARVVQGSEANAEGTLHNFKASVAGTYSFFILKDKTAEEGKTVYIGYSNSQAEPNVIKLYFADAFNWASATNPMYVYTWGGNAINAQWPGVEATYVGLDSADRKVYSYDVDLSLYDHIIFHVGENKTQDIDISSAVNNQGYIPVGEFSNGYPVESYTYTPKEEINIGHTVSFNANGGSGSKAPVTNVDGLYTLPDETGFTAPDGFEFVGWAYSADGEVITDESIYVTEDTVLYAIWEEDQPVSEVVTLYLTATWNDWESVQAYAYSSSGDEEAQWPGRQMTYVGVNDYNDTIFSYDVDISLYDKIIFHNAYDQTVDIDISDALNGDAYSLLETMDSSNHVEVEKWGTFTDAALTSKTVVYFTNNKNWTDLHFYVFNKSTSAVPENGGWPGVDAKWVAANEYHEDIYRIVIDASLYDYFIFNGGGNQTIDIALSSLTDGNNAFYLLDTQDGSGHYEVGLWKYNPLG